MEDNDLLGLKVNNPSAVHSPRKTVTTWLEGIDLSGSEVKNLQEVNNLGQYPL